MRRGGENLVSFASVRDEKYFSPVDIVHTCYICIGSYISLEVTPNKLCKSRNKNDAHESLYDDLRACKALERSAMNWNESHY